MGRAILGEMGIESGHNPLHKIEQSLEDWADRFTLDDHRIQPLGSRVHTTSGGFLSQAVPFS